MLPQPVMGDAADEMLVRPRSLAFPAPMFKMPYELSLDAPPDYAVQTEDGMVRVQLPIYVRAEVFPPNAGTECMLIATSNCRYWGQGDGLTAYSCVRRTDFHFRTRVFDRFPTRVRRHCHERLQEGRWNELSMALSENYATYWINGKRIATMTVTGGDIPAAELYVGLISYDSAYRVRGLDVSRDPELLQAICKRDEMHALGILKERILTMFVTCGDNNLVSISCTSIAGGQVASFEGILSTTLLKAFRGMLSERLELNQHRDELRLVLPNGVLLGEADDLKPLEEIARL